MTLLIELGQRAYNALMLESHPNHSHVSEATIRIRGYAARLK